MNHEAPITKWNDLIEKLSNYKKGWIFRGQNRGTDLKSKFERIIEKHTKEFINKRAICEKNIISELRRKYHDIDSSLVEKDTLYALSIIRHFEGPTRLLDATYSKYIAIFNALIEPSATDSKENHVFIWLMNEKWNLEMSYKYFGKKFIYKRIKDRTEETFLKMYMNDKPKNYVFIENPYKINERLNIQQGVFLCQGNISVSFMENLKAMDNWEQNNQKIILNFTEEERINSLIELHRMNINKRSLYPGKEGFIKDLNDFILRNHQLIN